jgi:hypothetical protein
MSFVVYGYVVLVGTSLVGEAATVGAGVGVFLESLPLPHAAAVTMAVATASDSRTGGLLRIVPPLPARRVRRSRRVSVAIRRRLPEDAIGHDQSEVAQICAKRGGEGGTIVGHDRRYARSVPWLPPPLV